MSQWKFEKGLHEVGRECWAWLQPDGSWGYSNAGLIADGEASLLVDTLFDLPLTEAMLAAMRDASPAAKQIDTVVNTHANGDHCYGNALVKDSEIIASTASLEEMDEVPPQLIAQLLENAEEIGPAGAVFKRIFGKFQFAGIEQVKANRSFEGRLSLRVGDKPVELIEVGPAHTRGDVLVHSVADRVVYTGDILFIEGTPIMWAGPVENWIRACRAIEGMDVDVVVPGHGPIVGPEGAAAVRGYLEYVRDEARARFDAGMSAADAARDIALGDYSSWGDSERIAVNVDTLYREFDPKHEPGNLVELFTLMGELTPSQARR